MEKDICEWKYHRETHHFVQGIKSSKENEHTIGVVVMRATTTLQDMDTANKQSRVKTMNVCFKIFQHRGNSSCANSLLCRLDPGLSSPSRVSMATQNCRIVWEMPHSPLGPYWPWKQRSKRLSFLILLPTSVYPPLRLLNTKKVGLHQPVTFNYCVMFR